MSKSATIPPLEKLEDDGTADILFVMPYMKSPEAKSIRHSQLDKEFWSIVRNTLPSFAAITIKQDAGKWEGERAEGRVKKYAWRITEAVSFYSAKCVVFLGQGLARLLVPDFKNSKYDIRGTFGTYRMPDLEHAHGGNIMCMAYGLPENIVGDPLECCRMSEMMAKLAMIRKGYYKKPKITNLDTYKKAKEYIDFLSNDHTGLIGFDTETYSLNRVHHQRLGSMQFAHNTKEAAVLLWDSKHQQMSKRDLERLRDPLVKLFSGNNTKFDAWVMHNGMFDTMQINSAFGTSVEGTIIDTMVFAHLMDESRKRTARVHVDFPLALKTLVQEFLGFFWYSDEAMKARGNGTLMELPLPDFLEYSGFDPSCTLRLYQVFKQWAVFEKYDEKVLNLLRKLLSRAIGLYSDISRNGFYIDRDRLITLLRKDSVINKRVDEINEAYKKFPQVRAVNTDMLADVSGVAATSFLKVPWIFDITKQKHRLALFYDSRDGFQFEPIQKPGTDVAKRSTGKEFQKLHKDNPVVALYAEAQGLCKLRDAYVRPLFESLFGNPDPNADTCDGRVHSWFHLTRTVTGRIASSEPNCIREGTPIAVPANYRTNPKQTVAIEQLNVGDYVFCRDREDRLGVSTVTDKWYKGTAQCLRIYVRGNNGRFKGHLDVTLDHKLRHLDGSWVHASDLVVGDRLMALSLLPSGTYSMSNGNSGITHRSIAESVFHRNNTAADLEVHHRDGDHANNNIDNLEFLTVAEHGEAHRVLGRTVSSVHSNRYAALRLLAKCAGRTARCRGYGVDFSCFIKTLAEFNIDPKLVRSRFGQDNGYLSKARVLEAVTTSNMDTAARDLCIGTRTLKTLCSFYGVLYGEASKKAYQPDMSLRDRHISTWKVSDRKRYARNSSYGMDNHVVVKIKLLKHKVRVWDIGVKGKHNFFAGTINVHNCQQVPRSDNPVKKSIKSLFCAAPGKVLVQADLSAAEIRTWGGLSGDDRICELSRVAFDLRRRVRENPDDLALREEAELKADFHKQTYGLCFNISPAAVTKAQRQDAKKLSFGLLYGMGDNAIAREIGKDLDSALDIKKRFFNVYKQGARWLLDMQDFALKHGYVETPLGRRRRFPEVFTGEGGAIAAAKRMAVNAPVQATASDYAMLSTILLNDALKRDKVTDDVKIVNCVHDSVVLEVTATEEWLRYTAKLVRKCFTKDVVKQLGKDFGFHLKAPIDIDMDVSQWQGRKCKHCGTMQYYTDGKTCVNKLPVLDDDGKPKKDADGNKVTKKCGHAEFEPVALNAGWGYLTALAENERSFGQAARGFTPIKSEAHKAAPEKASLSRKASKRRRLAFMHA